MENIERNKPESSSTNFKDDALSQTLGPERHGRVRTFGKGVTKTRLGILSQMDGKIAQVHEENFQLKTKVAHLENMMDEFKKNTVSTLLFSLNSFYRIHFELLLV